MANLRRKLGDDASAPWAIETIPDLGYRWVAQPDGTEPAEQPAADRSGRPARGPATRTPAERA